MCLKSATEHSQALIYFWGHVASPNIRGGLGGQLSCLYHNCHLSYTSWQTSQPSSLPKPSLFA